MNKPVQMALRLAQRLRIQNRRLVAAWVAMLSAVIASFYLGLEWNAPNVPLIFGEETCTPMEGSLLWMCHQGEKRFIVLELSD